MEHYVRFVEAPNIRMGTVAQGIMEAGKEKYLFHHDERFHDTIPDLYVFSYDIEVCPRPSDEHVKAINALIKRGT